MTNPVTIHEIDFSIDDNVEFFACFENTISHLSSDADILDIASQISAQLTQKLFQVREDRIAEEAERNKPKNRFSNFGHRTSTASTASAGNKFSSFKSSEVTLNSLTLSALIKSLSNLGILQDAHLTDTYRLLNSPYSYTISKEEWSSPFGNVGTTAEPLLNELIDRLHINGALDKDSFIAQVLQNAKPTNNGLSQYL